MCRIRKGADRIVLGKVRYDHRQKGEFPNAVVVRLRFGSTRRIGKMPLRHELVECVSVAEDPCGPKKVGRIRSRKHHHAVKRMGGLLCLPAAILMIPDQYVRRHRDDQECQDGGDCQAPARDRAQERSVETGAVPCREAVEFRRQ